jgi:hypothetical protein
MAAVQFFGKESVLNAYNHRKIETWGLFQGKSFITSGGSVEELSTFLAMLEPGGSTAPYTLKVYRDIDDPEEVTEKSEANGSFSFKLTDPGYSSRGVGAAVPNELMQRMDKLEQLISGTEEEEEEESIQDIIMGYLKDPNKLSFAISAIKGLVTGVMSPQPVGAVGAVTSPGSQEEKLERLSIALDTLESKDAKIVEHLEALAKIAQEKPGTFDMLLKMLENGI